MKRVLVPATFLLAALAGCHNTAATPLAAGAPPMPSEVRFVSRADWGAHAPVLPMTQHVPTRITIHHTGTAQSFTRTIEQKMQSLQMFSQRDDSLASGKKKPAWADVPYHYYVAVDGSVAEGREWNYVGDTNTEYNPAGHLLVVVEGSFDTDTLTTAQRRTLDLLIPALARHFPRRAADGLVLRRRQAAAGDAVAGHQLPRFRALAENR